MFEIILNMFEIMPNQSLKQMRFDDMKNDALDETEMKDLTPLLCGMCELCTTFGGSEFFEESIFTLLDVCICQE